LGRRPIAGAASLVRIVVTVAMVGAGLLSGAEGRDGGPSTKENCAPRGNKTIVAVHLFQKPTELEFPS
jgi:hypothetical protein